MSTKLLTFRIGGVFAPYDDPETNTLLVNKAFKGHKLDAPVQYTKAGASKPSRGLGR